MPYAVVVLKWSHRDAQNNISAYPFIGENPSMGLNYFNSVMNFLRKFLLYYQVHMASTNDEPDLKEK